jgi:hypothetical protein
LSYFLGFSVVFFSRKKSLEEKERVKEEESRIGRSKGNRERGVDSGLFLKCRYPGFCMTGTPPSQLLRNFF